MIFVNTFEGVRIFETVFSLRSSALSTSTAESDLFPAVRHFRQFVERWEGRSLSFKSSSNSSDSPDYVCSSTLRYDSRYTSLNIFVLALSLSLAILVITVSFLPPNFFSSIATKSPPLQQALVARSLRSTMQLHRTAVQRVEPELAFHGTTKSIPIAEKPNASAPRYGLEEVTLMKRTMLILILLRGMQMRERNWGEREREKT